MRFRLASLLAAVAAALIAAPAAFASLSSEVASGQTIAGQLQSGTASCKSLSGTNFEHLGEYVMQQMLGSSSLHEAMNARMSLMIGSVNADRMHEALGRSFAGCLSSGRPGYAGMGMMGGGTSTGGWAAMMASANWSWMRDGSWQHMSRANWNHVASTVMGPGMMYGADGGWSTGDIRAAVLGGLLLVAVIGYAATRLRRRPPATDART